MGLNWLERALASIRWLLLPFYVIAAVALAALLGKAAMQAWDLVVRFAALSTDEVILSALAVVDLTLTASLLVIVALAGFVNFVSPIDVAAHKEWPDWIAHVDFAEMKRKLMGSIAVIAAIKLLEAFMNVDHQADRELLWMTAIQVVFVVSALALSIGDRVSKGGPHA